MCYRRGLLCTYRSGRRRPDIDVSITILETEPLGPSHTHLRKCARERGGGATLEACLDVYVTQGSLHM